VKRLGFLAALWLAVSSAQTGKQVPPQLMLWSWFAGDDFRPLANRQVGVAYLALSLQFEGRDAPAPSPRLTPVRIPPGMYDMAVVRFDASREPGKRPAYSQKQRELATRMIAEIYDIVHPKALQIDFDAPESARPFYRQLLSDVRARLGPGVFLSMTALVSWCASAGSWLSDLPVDEIVPMTFSMGGAYITPEAMAKAMGTGEFPCTRCRSSIGIELPAGVDAFTRRDLEPAVRPRKQQRAYFFAAMRPWTPELLSKAQRSFLP
jgi:hypothetical protein